jgi:hypothetical protein
MALNLIAEIMGWPPDDEATATREYATLRLMSAVKYDSYSDFRAGVRFLENFATWLKQFKLEDRNTAYEFVKSRLVYISIPELHCLVESFLSEIVTPIIRREIASEMGVASYEVWSKPEGYTAFKKRLRKTLFVGLSDGSRMDVLRRSNSRILSTEQVVPMMNIDDEKWTDLRDKLREAPGMTETDKFESVYLVDDFTASGTTFIREIEGKWKGKLKKFNDIIRTAKSNLKGTFPVSDNYALHIHHYISSAQAADTLQIRMKNAESWTEKTYGTWRVTEGLRLPPNMKLEGAPDGAILDLCDRYYDNALFERLKNHCLQAGQTTMKIGYADCALPIVLDHNTPNNSIPLLWADTEGNMDAHPMTSLFRRRDRHG